MKRFLVTLFLAAIATFSSSSLLYAQDDIYAPKTPEQQSVVIRKVRKNKQKKLRRPGRALFSSTPSTPADSLSLSEALHLSGKYLRKSATFDGAAIGCAAAGAIMAGIGASMDDSDKAKPLYISASVMGGVALICRIVSVTYKSRAGQSLTLAPGSLTFRF